MSTKISDLISHLNYLKNLHGDLAVMSYPFEKFRIEEDEDFGRNIFVRQSETLGEHVVVCDDYE